MNFLRGRDDEHMALKMTAMIDVVFQLLIFFLVATKFRVPQGELDAYLPDEGAPKTTQERDVPVDELIITLRVSQRGASSPDAEPSVLLDGQSAGPTARSGSMRWLESELRRLAKDPRMRENVPIIIEAEPHLAYQWVIYTLNLCRMPDIGFEKVNFAASKRNAPAPAGKSPPG